MKKNYYSSIKFEKQNEGFLHNLENDFGCIALWKSARPYRDKIRELLISRFDILLETEIQWSQKNFHSNANRLYETPIYSNLSEQKSSHSNKIGDTKFILFIIRDSKPHYTYAQSVSGKIELSNVNIVNAKYLIRDWIKEDSGVKYGVHSTNNINEFFFQVPLLLGKHRFHRLLNGEKLIEEKIVKDLEGAEGWCNYEEMFEILNLTTNYLVQRGFESLPVENPEMDIDFLTDNYQRLASAIGAKQILTKLYKGNIEVGSQKISLDIRFLDDKYYATLWAKNMLDTKVINKDIFIPRDDYYFFSLLYHAKVQKALVKDKYIFILEMLAEKLSFSWYKSEYLSDDRMIGEILNGFFQSEYCFYEDPIDRGVYKNINVIKYLPKITKSPFHKGNFEVITISKLKRYLPHSVIKILKKLKN